MSVTWVRSGDSQIYQIVRSGKFQRDEDRVESSIEHCQSAAQRY